MDQSSYAPELPATLPAWLAGRSAPMRALERAASDLGHAEVNLLLQGENGTGKLALAEAIHAQSPRAAGPFIVVPVAKCTEAETRQALFGDDGPSTVASEPPGVTLYIDGVEGLTADLQRQLLLALNSAGVWSGVRVISGAHAPLEEAVRLGRFRRDLFFRVGVVRVSIPPLRERREDIPLIAKRIVEERPSPRDGLAGFVGRGDSGRARRGHVAWQCPRTRGDPRSIAACGARDVAASRSSARGRRSPIAAGAAAAGRLSAARSRARLYPCGLDQLQLEPEPIGASVGDRAEHALAEDQSLRARSGRSGLTSVANTFGHR